MSDVRIKIKRSVTPGNVPTDLELGELAINIPDKKIYIGDDSTDTVGLLVDGNATGGGTPAGNDREIQFNDNGSFGSTSDLTWEESATCGSGCNTSYLEFNNRSGLKLYENSANGTNYIAFIAPSSITDTSGKPYVFPEGTSTTGSILTLTSASNGVYTLNWTKAIVADSVESGPINNVTITAPATAATLTIANNKTITLNNTLTFTGTDSSSVAFGSGGTVAYTSNKLSVFAATTSAELAGVISDETGTGSLVFGTSPSFTTGVATGSTTFGVFDTTATTVNAFGAATTLNIGYDGTAAASTTNIAKGDIGEFTKTINIGTSDTTNVVVGSSLQINIGNVYTGGTTVNILGNLDKQTGSSGAIFNTPTNITFAQSATTLSMGAISGSASIRNPTLRVGNTNGAIVANEGTLTLSGGTTLGLPMGSTPSLSIDFAGGGEGFVSIVGGNLYLGNKSTEDLTFSPVQIVFEGTTTNNFETTLTLVDPTADRTITLPDLSGTVGLVPGSNTQVVYNNNGALGATSAFIYDSAANQLTVDAGYVKANFLGAVQIEVRNTTGSPITGGTPVYAVGYSGGRVLIAPADAADSAKMPAIGIVETTIADSNNGHATVLGVLRNINTSTYSVNQTLYVASGGGLTNIRPTSSSVLVQNMGKVVDVGNNGEILVFGPGRTNDVPNQITVNGSIIFEGATADDYETTLTVTDPTADRTITLPNISGTVITTGDTGTVTNTMLAGSIANDKLLNSAITVNGSSISLGGSATVTATATNALTLGSGLTGTSYNGSTAVTAAVDTSIIATKSYVDSVAQGLHIHSTAKAATTAKLATLTGATVSYAGGAITWTGGTAANDAGGFTDGVVLTANTTEASASRILVKNEGDAGGLGASKNGTYYVYGARELRRTSDGDTAADWAGGDFCFVTEGTSYNNTGWIQTEIVTNLDTDSILWEQFSGAGTYTADEVTLTKSGSQFAIKNTYAGQTSIVTLGTVATGTWNASTIATNKGGTGLTSFTTNGAVYATSTSALTTGTLPVASGGTGITSFGSGIATWLGTPSSANLAAAITDETGSGALVFGTSPVFTTSITTGSTTFSVFNTTATTVNAFGAATSLTIGATSGTTVVRTPAFRIGNTSATIDSANGTLSLTAGNTVSPLWSGTKPIINMQNNYDATGLIQIEGGDVALYSKTDDSPSEVQTHVALRFYGAYTNYIALVGSAVVSTNKTITLPDATGTVALTANKLSAFAATTSSELAGIISDETGTGVLVFGTSPSFTTSVATGSTTFDVFDTTATTINAFGASTTLTIGHDGTSTSTTNIVTGAVAASNTKTINIGTGGAGSSITNIYIGSLLGTSYIEARGSIYQFGTEFAIFSSAASPDYVFMGTGKGGTKGIGVYADDPVISPVVLTIDNQDGGGEVKIFGFATYDYTVGYIYCDTPVFIAGDVVGNSNGNTIALDDNTGIFTVAANQLYMAASDSRIKFYDGSEQVTKTPDYLLFNMGIV
jgi:hypothetical protein